MATGNATCAAERICVETELGRAQTLTALAQWVEHARQLTQELDAAAQGDEKLRDHLERLGVSYGNASGWDDAESRGLVWLHCEIEGAIVNVKKATTEARHD